MISHRTCSEPSPARSSKQREQPWCRAAVPPRMSMCLLRVSFPTSRLNIVELSSFSSFSSLDSPLDGSHPRSVRCYSREPFGYCYDSCENAQVSSVHWIGRLSRDRARPASNTHPHVRAAARRPPNSGLTPSRDDGSIGSIAAAKDRFRERQLSRHRHGETAALSDNPKAPNSS